MSDGKRTRQPCPRCECRMKLVASAPAWGCPSCGEMVWRLHRLPKTASTRHSQTLKRAAILVLEGMNR